MKNTGILLKITLLIGLIFFLHLNHASPQHFQSFFLNIQADAGPDTTICGGSSVTLGVGPSGAGYCYHWEPVTGLSNPNILHPTASPASTTTYTLTITGPDFSFKSSDQVTITVIEIKNITFNPPQILNNGTATTTASVVTVPAGRQVIWSIIGPNLGCTINPNTGVITAGTQGGVITVRATDLLYQQMGIDCYTEKGLCVGDGSQCCGEKSGTVTFGPISFSIPGGPILPTGPQDAGGYCPYQVNAAISIDMLGTFQRSASLTGVTISWKEKYNNPLDFKDVTINWTGNYTLATFGLVEAKLTTCSLTVSSSGALSGMCTFTVNQTQDVPIGSIAVLKQGLSGTFTYSYNNTNGWTGTWDFGGITGFEVHLKKGTNVIAKITAQNFDSNGNINNATLAAETPAIWYPNNFTVELNQLSLTFNYNIANSQITFVGGSGQVTVKNIPNVQGEFTLALTFTPSTVSASVTMTNVEAFGCTVSGTLTVDFNYDFDLQTLSGTGISAQHNEFNQAFTGIEFEIKDGALEKFNMGQISVKYKNKIEFSMMNASYAKAESKLVFSAKVSLPALQLDVTNFKINLSDGAVSVERIVGDVNQSPVTVHIDVNFGTDEFSGSFSGSFAGGVAINGNLVIGATSTFNYGYFSIGISGPGIPLGSSGLKVTSLTGEFGYNWAAATPTPTSTPTGSHQLGTTTIGFGLGISDMANLVEIAGYIQFILGSTSQVSMTGMVKVTASSPHYFEGSLTISYVLGSTQIIGTLTSQVNFPPSTGEIVHLNTGAINFKINTNQWYCTANNITGKIFNEIDASATINISAPLSSPASISGTINGSLNYDNNFSFAYPGGFDATNCTTADATDNALGFGVSGNLALHLGGSISANMNSNGIVGSISAQASANCALSIKWPCFIICGWNCVDTYNASVEGNITVERTAGSTRIHGFVTFSYSGEQETGEIDFTI